MYTLSEKSPDEIRDLLDRYGIKHGPVLDSTRSLYEKKIREAMAKEKRASQTKPDKTYYREEEEVTYVYSTPARSELPEVNRPYMRARPGWTDERELQHEHYSYNTSSPNTSASLRATPTKSYENVPKEQPQSSRFIPVWMQLVFFAVALIFLYFVFANMESNDYTKSIE
ncbi:uncharacterized protein LOC144084278 isoform X2 [Stigmatopora argus]